MKNKNVLIGVCWFSLCASVVGIWVFCFKQKKHTIQANNWKSVFFIKLFIFLYDLLGF